MFRGNSILKLSNSLKYRYQFRPSYWSRGTRSKNKGFKKIIAPTVETFFVNKSAWVLENRRHAFYNWSLTFQESNTACLKNSSFRYLSFSISCRKMSPPALWAVLLSECSSFNYFYLEANQGKYRQHENCQNHDVTESLHSHQQSSYDCLQTCEKQELS